MAQAIRRSRSAQRSKQALHVRPCQGRQRKYMDIPGGRMPGYIA